MSLIKNYKKVKALLICCALTHSVHQFTSEKLISKTLLILSCYNDYEKEAKCMLQNGADVNEKNSIGYTPLHHACSNNKNAPLVKLFLQNGANIHAKNENGSTPAHIACLHDCDDNLIHLFLHGANFNTKNDTRETPIDYAELYATPQTIQLLKDLQTIETNFNLSTPEEIKIQLCRFIACNMHPIYTQKKFMEQDKITQKNLMRHALLHNEAFFRQCCSHHILNLRDLINDNDDAYLQKKYKSITYLPPQPQASKFANVTLVFKK